MASRTQPDYVEKNVFVTVKAYPNPSKAYRETVCVAGITDEGRFIRLYPVRFRDLEREDQFKTYSWIHVRVFKAARDSRPESFHLDYDWPIKVTGSVSTKDGWVARRKIVEPLRNASLEELISVHKVRTFPLASSGHETDGNSRLNPRTVQRGRRKRKRNCDSKNSSRDPRLSNASW